METTKISLEDPFNDFLADYIDEKLDAIELQAFREYLCKSEAERKFAEQAKKAKEALDRLPVIKAAADFEEKLAQRIAAERELLLVEEEL
jgi:hypothetical protein